MEELELEEEDEAEEVSSHLLDQLTTGVGGTTCGSISIAVQ